MIKKLTILILIFFSFISCKDKNFNSDKKIRIGFSTSSEIFLQERWSRDISIFTSRAGELGAEVIFSKSSEKSSGQKSEILYLGKQDIDILVVIPRDLYNLSDSIKKIIDKGIPVICYDRLIMDVPLAGYISFDNQEVGKHMGNALIQVKPKGNYLIINGSIHDNNSYEVSTGLHKILDPKIASGDINLVSEIWLNAWSYDEALFEIGKVFNERQDIDAISSANDMMAQAAIKILAEKRLAGKVFVVGQDADLVACQSIVDGTQLMTVYKPIHKLAVRAAEISVAIAKGEEPEPDLYINNRSSKSIPYFIERPIPVYIGSMKETIVKDGFHSRADIYRDM